MTRILCIDYGEKRLGIALSDPLGLTAQPYPYILNNEHTIKAISDLIDDKNVTQILLGLPLNQHGEESVKSAEVRSFSTVLEDAVSIPIAFWDERYSTAAVTRHLIDADVSRKKRKEVIDSQAAMFILQGYMDSLS